jgi:hypothetical protein
MTLESGEKYAQFFLGMLGALLPPAFVYHALSDSKPFKISPMNHEFLVIGNVVLLLTMFLCALLTIVFLRFLRGITICIFPMAISPLLAWAVYMALMQHYSIVLPTQSLATDLTPTLYNEGQLATTVLSASQLSFVLVIPISVGASLIFWLRRRRLNAIEATNT